MEGAKISQEIIKDTTASREKTNTQHQIELVADDCRRCCTLLMVDVSNIEMKIVSM